MSDTENLLQSVVELIRRNPQSAPALTLYALVNTMNYEQAGCLFKLNKLRDIGAEERQLAYSLIELMVNHGNQGPAWEEALQEMDRLVRGN